MPMHVNKCINVYTYINIYSTGTPLGLLAGKTASNLCIYVCIYIYIYTCVNVYLYACAYVCLHNCIYRYICIFIGI
jgi:hypothetical protein